jgi:hypothetical protein
MATVLLTALAAVAQAGPLPKAVRMVDRMKMYSGTHFVRGEQAGGGSGGGSMTAEARRSDPVPASASKQKGAPQPARAD